MAGASNPCIFCQIARSSSTPTDGTTPILYSDDRVVAFPDINPAAFRHYLVIPVQHIPTTEDLQSTTDDYQLVKHMLHIGRTLMDKDAPSSKKHRFGFHRPPYYSVDHLHLHCLALPFIPRWKEVKYMPLGPFVGFVEADELLKRIKPPTEMENKKGCGRSYFSWSVQADEMILRKVCDAIKEGNGKTPDGKIRVDTWLKVIDDYNKETGGNIQKKNIDSRMKTWRQMYKIYTKIGAQSGWGWNYIHGHTDIAKEVWDEFVMVHPECAQYKGKACPIYDQLQIIFEGNLATGSTKMSTTNLRAAVNLNEDTNNLDNVPLTQNTMEFEAETQDPFPTQTPSPSLNDVDSCRKGKRPRPHAESQQLMASTMNNVGVSLMNYFSEDLEENSRKMAYSERAIQLQENMISIQKEKMAFTQRIEERKLAYMERKMELLEKKDREEDDVLTILLSLTDLTEEEKYKAMQLLEIESKKNQFRRLPPNMRTSWLKFNLK